MKRFIDYKMEAQDIFQVKKKDDLKFPVPKSYVNLQKKKNVVEVIYTSPIYGIVTRKNFGDLGNI